MKNVNIQLYSVRNSLKEDFKGTLKKIADIGYDGVEFCMNFGGMSADELSEYLDFLGLDFVALHTSLETLEDDGEFDRITEYLSKCGCLYVVDGYESPESVEEAILLGQRQKKMAEKLAMNGFNYLYHTHGNELKRKDENGNTYFDIMMNETELTLVEFDIFWLEWAGVSIDDYFRKYAGKINLVHLKQMKDLDKKEECLAKDGCINYTEVIKSAKKFGAEYFIIEQGQCDDEMHAAKQNYEFVKSINV